MRAALLAIGFVLVGATDWRIEPAGICAVDQPSCEAALAAHERGWVFRDLPANAVVACVPKPSCRDAREDCIVGFNCGRR